MYYWKTMSTNILGDNAMESNIMEYIKSHPRGTWNEEIARELKLNRATVSKYLTRLEALGKIELEKKGPMNMIFPLYNIK